MNKCYENRCVSIYSPSKGPQALIGFKVRVKLRISVKGLEKSCETVALVNSGFETTTPQLLIPRGLAEELAIWPGMLPGAKVVAYGIAEGIVRNYLILNVVEVSIAEENVQSKRSRLSDIRDRGGSLNASWEAWNSVRGRKRRFILFKSRSGQED
ncbi:MAG: hypothetical protein QXK88_09975 [Desulfurococcaceae archaeon]